MENHFLMDLFVYKGSEFFTWVMSYSCFLHFAVPFDFAYDGSCMKI